jgi:hypothetical protein
MKRIKSNKNKMTLKKGLLLAGLMGASIALLSQPALAAKQGKTYHEEEWKKTKTYGNTLIAEDSATEWGPWKQFIRPAAGPLAIAPMPGMRSDGANYYRPESVEEYSPKYTLDEEKEVIADTCQGGNWCGYMAYRTTNTSTGPWGPDKSIVTLYNKRGGPVPTRMTIGFTSGSDGVEGSASVAYALTRLTDNSLNNVEGEYYNSGDILVRAEDTSLASFKGYSDNFFDGQTPTNNEQMIYGAENQWNLWGATGNEDTRWGDSEWSGGPFVAGNTTPLADMTARNEMATPDVSASFNGFAAGGSSVAIDIYFADAKWNGTWNNNVDGALNFHTDSVTNEQYVTGQVGFIVNDGTIDGANFSGIVSGANNAQGTVIGNFFGDGATTLGGVSDVTKGFGRIEADARNVDVFVACEGSCSNLVD